MPDFKSIKTPDGTSYNVFDSTARSTATAAQQAAQQAQTTAKAAQNAANTAQSAAETAQSAAETAQSAAETAQSAADAVKEAVDGVKTLTMSYTSQNSEIVFTEQTISVGAAMLSAAEVAGMEV